MPPVEPHVARLVVADGVCSKLMDTFTGGVILAGLGVFVGADAFLLGVLASLPFLAQVFQFAAVRLMMTATDRRKVVVLASAISRGILVLIAGLLVWTPHLLTPALLVLLISVSASLIVIGTAAWNWWMRDLLPRESLGRFFANRLRVTTLLGAGAILLAGGLLDFSRLQGRTNEGFAVLFAVGAIAGFSGLYFLSETPHPAAKPPPQGPVVRRILAPLLDPVNRPLAIALSVVASTLAIALPFSAVFLLEKANYGFLPVTGLALMSQVGYVASVRGWGYLSDHFGIRPVLQIAVGLLTASLFGWILVDTQGGWLQLAYLVLLHFVAGYAIGGIELTAHNVLLKTAPDQDAPAYLASLGLARALAAGIATLAAGALWKASQGGIHVFGFGFDGFHLLAFLSAVVGLFALAALHAVNEPEGKPVHDVARAMRREVHLLSSVAGIRAFVHVVSYVVEFMARPRSGLNRGPPK